ncbi:hypothetical protein EOD41_07010 [Mucilaginibacter limnophilus]|uniref:DUF922 domain-containing protein n=1 Tax=Mucilaginibacter limnophilus TaxID=1932778 RepID=A0A3S2Y250_9SPHI|nr:hypothetical protein [Mucilaginibacter limnophilus]RVU01704.1 hypothetical protein EOD41_07010 [Mucilaginibacter limnophilus]
MVLKFISAAMGLVLLAATSALAQPYKLLTASDFQGIPHRTNFSAVAYTNCSISYSYNVSRIRGVFQLDFKVSMVMNKQLSWIDKSAIKSPEMMAEVLKHEQGHYAIAYLQQQEVLRTFGRTQFGRDYNMVARQIFDRIDKKYQAMNDNYERETNHMQNRVQQANWDRYLARCLEYIPPIVASN